MSADKNLDPILTERELAEWLSESRPTLQRQRSDGSGPPFVQLSQRRIGYRKSAVERWLETRTVNRINWPDSKTNTGTGGQKNWHGLDRANKGDVI
jgi:predicted DNA-binding transcriptional regulator AlpA